MFYVGLDIHDKRIAICVLIGVRRVASRPRCLAGGRIWDLCGVDPALIAPRPCGIRLREPIPGDREDSSVDFAAASGSISMVASRNRWGRGDGGVRRGPWRPEEREERFSSDAMAVDPVLDCRERRPAWH
jgi:hypothetical protein